MSTSLNAAGLLVIFFATQVAVAQWLFAHVLEVPSKRPWRAALATVVLTCLAVGPAVVGFDALLGGSLAEGSRMLFAFAVGVVQTGLVLRLIYRTTMPLAMGHSLVLNMTWAATSVLFVVLAERLGTFYASVPLALLIVAFTVKRYQDRELTRLMDSVPPQAPADLHAQRA